MKKQAPQGQKTAPAPQVAPASSFQLSDKTLQRSFYLSILAMLVFIWVAGFNSGFHVDEMDMMLYGKANVKYYATGGKDTSFAGYKNPEEDLIPLLKYYGGIYEYFQVGLNKALGTIDGPQEFNVRHIFNEFIAILGIMFAGLTARKIAGWRAALFTVWLLYLTPFFFGHAMINTKDMPFCAGYIASLYFMISWLEELPNPRWKTSIFFMLSFAFATGVRIAGVLLIFYWLVFLVVYLLANKQLMASVRQNIRTILAQMATVGMGGMAIVVVTWPYLLQSPVKHFMETLGVVKKFPQKIKMVFEGNIMDSLHVPNYYVPKFMLITIPLSIIAAILAGVVIFFALRKRYNVKIGALLLFAIIFPVVYILYSNPAIYCGWRHVMFIYPSMCIFGAIALASVATWLRKPVFQGVFVLAFLATLATPITWSIKNHPYEYTYFNAWGGGFKKAFYDYENEYWQITTKNAVDWMMKNEPIEQSKDSVIIASNARAFLTYYLRVHYPKAKVRVVGCGYTERNSVLWHYAVFHPIFLEPNYLNYCYPPKGQSLVHSVDIDDLPISIVLKDTTRYDFMAISTLMTGNFNRADSFFNVYFKQTNTSVDDYVNVDVYPYLSIIRGYQLKTDDAIKYGTKCFDFYMPPNLMYFTYCGMAIGYANGGKFKEGIKSCEDAMKLQPNQPLAKAILNDINNFMRQQRLPNAPPKP